ncbi:MAG: hypothetical protein ACRELS_00575 [Candidatus Rokuibacteriota bacterium]
MDLLSRRELLGSALGVLVIASSHATSAWAQAAPPPLTVHKDPT